MKSNKWPVRLLAAAGVLMLSGPAWAAGRGVEAPNPNASAQLAQAGCTQAAQALSGGMTAVQASQSLRMPISQARRCEALSQRLTRRVPTGTALRMGIKP
jgi:uncharacterized protein YciI